MTYEILSVHEQMTYAGICVVTALRILRIFREFSVVLQQLYLKIVLNIRRETSFSYHSVLLKV